MTNVIDSLKGAGDHIAQGGKAMWGHVQTGYGNMNSAMSGAIKEHNGVIGAAKAVAKDHPLAALGVAAIAAIGAVHIAGMAFSGNHMRNEQDRRAGYEGHRR